MTVMADADRWRSAAHRNLIAHLTGPLGAGAVDSAPPMKIDGASATVAIAERTRQPLVIASLRRNLGPETLRVSVNVTPQAGAASDAELTFAPFSEAGAALPVVRPPVAGELGTADPMTITVSATRIAAGGTQQAVPAADIPALVEIQSMTA